RAVAIVVRLAQGNEVGTAFGLGSDFFRKLPGCFPIAVRGAWRVRPDADVLPLDGVVNFELVGMFLVVIQQLLAADLVEERSDTAGHVLGCHELPRPLPADRVQRQPLLAEQVLQLLVRLEAVRHLDRPYPPLVELLVSAVLETFERALTYFLQPADRI